MKKGSVLILGSRSDISLAMAHEFAQESFNIQLAARNVESLKRDKDDIEFRYHVIVSLHEFDALDIESHERFVVALPELPSIAICAVGYLGDQAESEQDVLCAAHVMRSNYEGPTSILAVLANYFEQRGFGCLVGISSVAGERGRAANYVYGSAKAGFTAFLSGLRNRLASRGVHVITVLPGFVHTKMTQGIDLPKNLTAQPEHVAQRILKAVERSNDVVYHKTIWRAIMFVIRNIPENIFKRLKI